jgi:Fe2+ or Zn2+ uptake regulation protein
MKNVLFHPDSNGGGKGEDEIAQDILNYLRSHPEASDTLEGIAKWWLMRQRVSDSTEVVWRVLERLRDQGLIHERRLEGGGTLYQASGPEEAENRQDAKSAKKK